MIPVKLGPVVQSIVSLISLSMTNSLNVKSYSHFFSAKISIYLSYFKIEILPSPQLTTSLSFEQLGPGVIKISTLLVKKRKKSLV